MTDAELLAMVQQFGVSLARISDKLWLSQAFVRMSPSVQAHHTAQGATAVESLQNMHVALHTPPSDTKEPTP